MIQHIILLLITHIYKILDNNFHQTYKLINHTIADMSFDLSNKEETLKLIENFEKNYKKNRTVSNFNL